MNDINTPITNNLDKAPFGDSRGASSVITKPKNITDQQFAMWKKIHDEAQSLGDPFPRVTANQAAIESGWFKKPSGKNNYFGIKARPNEVGTITKTKEQVGDKKISTTAKFKDYNSITDAIKDRVTRFAPIYKDAQSTQEANAMIAQAGYATDSNYLNLLNSVDKMMGGTTQPYTPKPTQPSRQQLLNNTTQLNNVAVNNTRVAQPRMIMPEQSIGEPITQQQPNKFIASNINSNSFNTQPVNQNKQIADKKVNDNYLGFIDNYLNTMNTPQNQMAMGGFVNNNYNNGGTINQIDPPKKKPIYVESENDPRYRAYQDSLSLYKGANSVNDFIKKNNIGTFKKDNDKPLSEDQKKHVKIKKITYNKNNVPSDILKKLGNNSLNPNIKPVSYDKYVATVPKKFSFFGAPSDELIYENNVLANYKNPKEEVIVKPTTSKQTATLSNTRLTPLISQRAQTKPLENNLQPQGLIQNNFNLEAVNIPQYAQQPKSYNVNTQRSNMQGQSDYYQNNQEGVNYKKAIQIQEASDSYNKYIQNKYGNSNNPKAMERLKSLQQQSTIISNFAMGGKINGQANGNSLNSFNTGGLHEENPLGGVPQGMGSNGQMNTVEEGETSFKSKKGKYIFSDRLKL